MNAATKWHKHKNDGNLFILFVRQRKNLSFSLNVQNRFTISVSSLLKTGRSYLLFEFLFIIKTSNEHISAKKLNLISRNIVQQERKMHLRRTNQSSYRHIVATFSAPFVFVLLSAPTNVAPGII